jgi:hypothetical protein
MRKNMRQRFTWPIFPLAALLILGSACGKSANTTDGGVDSGIPPITDAGPIDVGTTTVKVGVTNDSAHPFAATTGDFAYVTDTQAIGVTDQGLVSIDLTGANAGKMSQGLPAWTLTSSGSGQSASAVAAVPVWSVAREPYAFFLPSGRPQLGALRIGTAAMPGSVVSEHVLTQPLSSMFPSALVAPTSGPGSSGLWIVDAVFGPGSSVRYFPYTMWNVVGPMIGEDQAHRFTIPDGTTPNRLVFADDGKVGLVSYTFLAPAPAGVAGGVYAFDPTNGTQLGKLVLPLSSTVAGALEYVASVAATPNFLVVVSGVKDMMFKDLGGRIAIYKVKTWMPFAVEDEDAAMPNDQPFALLHTSVPNGLGVAIKNNVAIVVSAPIGANGALDVVTLDAMPPKITSTLPLGKPYTMGFLLPGDPKISPDGSVAMIPTEVGLLRITLDVVSN